MYTQKSFKIYLHANLGMLHVLGVMNIGISYLIHRLTMASHSQWLVNYSNRSIVSDRGNMTHFA